MLIRLILISSFFFSCSPARSQGCSNQLSGDWTFSISGNNLRYGSPARIPFEGLLKFNNISFDIGVERRVFKEFRIGAYFSSGSITDLSKVRAQYSEFFIKVDHPLFRRIQILPNLKAYAGFDLGIIRLIESNIPSENGNFSIVALRGTLEYTLNDSFSFFALGSYRLNGAINSRKLAFGSKFSPFTKLDSDRDGTPNRQDRCKKRKGPATNCGCPY